MTAAPGWPAPAKLNLFLRIIGRRDDGFHRLQTVFQFLDFGDTLYFDTDADGITRRRVLSQFTEAEDLSLRAARLLRERAGITAGVAIDINKRIPVGGGFGGGSSDAATTLVALNQLWGTGLDEDALAELGLLLGADVPVFVRGYAAWAEGVGERLTPVSPETGWYLVIAPDCLVSTAKVFNDAGLTRNSTPLKMAAALSDAVFADTGNDCESVVRSNYPAVAAALEWLGNYGQARMTGTGAGVFARFDRRQVADAVLEKLPPDWTGFVGRGLNRSPLLDRLERATAARDEAG